TEIMGLRFCSRSVDTKSCAQISFYDRQNSHFMTDEFHFMTDKFHFMTEPTIVAASHIQNHHSAFDLSCTAGEKNGLPHSNSPENKKATTRRRYCSAHAHIRRADAADSGSKASLR